MNGENRADISTGTRVQVVQKQDQLSGKLSEGIVKDILTKSPKHPHGIKVASNQRCGRPGEKNPSLGILNTKDEFAGNTWDRFKKLKI